METDENHHRLEAGRGGLRAAIEGRRTDHLQHQDLWCSIRRAVASRGPPREWFDVMHVPSHLGEKGINSGRISVTHAFLNEGADAAAVAAAAEHAVPVILRAEVRRRIHLAVTMHNMMANILEMRASAVPMPGREAGFTPAQLGMGAHELHEELIEGQGWDDPEDDPGAENPFAFPADMDEA